MFCLVTILLTEIPEQEDDGEYVNYESHSDYVNYNRWMIIMHLMFE